MSLLRQERRRITTRGAGFEPPSRTAQREPFAASAVCLVAALAWTLRAPALTVAAC